MGGESASHGTLPINRLLILPDPADLDHIKGLARKKGIHLEPDCSTIIPRTQVLILTFGQKFGHKF